MYPFNRVVVLSIGINRYPNLTGAPDLRFAEDDAKAFADLTRSRYGYEAVTLLGREAGRREIELAVKRHGGDLGEGDAFIVFFAGHGQVVERPDRGEAGYLVPADADLDLGNKTDSARWSEQALDMAALVELADGLPAKHVLLIADACCSGFMTRRGGLSRWDLKTLLTDRSRTALAATTARQSAREDVRRGHGYFTAALLEELSKDDAASVFDVHAGLLKAVGERTNGRMTPQLARFGDGDGAFVFVPASLPREELEADLAGVTPDRPGDAVKGLQGVAARVRIRAEQRTRPEEALRAAGTHPYAYASDPEGARVEWEEKFERFLRNAGAGEPWAMLAAHFCYDKGLGTGRDPEQALHWARQAARSDRPAGLREYLLARCYDLGLGVGGPAAARRAQARALFEASARAGFGLAKRAVALDLIAGGPKDPAATGRARTLLEEAVRDGVAAAEGDLGRLFYLAPPGVRQDFQKAVGLLERAAGRGDPEACASLYHVYLSGEEGTRLVGREKAGRYLRRAADAGLARALYHLGRETRGDSAALGLPPDPARTFELFERASAQGYGLSQLASAFMLAAGEGTPADPERARERLEAAIAGGLARARHVQGLWYYRGKVYEQDDARALRSFRLAADSGHAEAAAAASGMFRAGRGFKVVSPYPAVGGNLHWDFHRALHYGALSVKLAPDDFRVRSEFDEWRLRFLETYAARDPRAVAVVDKWRREYPESYRFYCEWDGCDPADIARPAKKPK